LNVYTEETVRKWVFQKSKKKDNKAGQRALNKRMRRKRK